jgi:hypothetical protein
MSRSCRPYGLRSNGCKTPSYVAAATLASTRASSKPRFAVRCSSTGSAKSAIRSYENQRHCASGLNLLVAFFGIPRTCSAPSIICENRGIVRSPAISSTCRPWVGTHQPDWRLPLGHVTSPRARSIPAAPDPRTRSGRRRLACLKFRFVSSPPEAGSITSCKTTASWIIGRMLLRLGSTSVGVATSRCVRLAQLALRRSASGVSDRERMGDVTTVHLSNAGASTRSPTRTRRADSRTRSDLPHRDCPPTAESIRAL